MNAVPEPRQKNEVRIAPLAAAIIAAGRGARLVEPAVTMAGDDCRRTPCNRDALVQPALGLTSRLTRPDDSVALDHDRAVFVVEAGDHGVAPDPWQGEAQVDLAAVTTIGTTQHHRLPTVHPSRYSPSLEKVEIRPLPASATNRRPLASAPIENARLYSPGP